MTTIFFEGRVYDLSVSTNVKDLQARLDEIRSTNTLWHGRYLQDACHNAAKTSGWWTNLSTGESLLPDNFNIPEKLMLIVSEVAEGMEGFRKNLQDDKLPHRKMLEVELADAVIRSFDLAGALSFDLGGAISEKLDYNSRREDHKPSHRAGEKGKKF